MDARRPKVPLSHYLIALLPFNFVTAVIAIGHTCDVALGNPISSRWDTLAWIIVVGGVSSTAAALAAVALGFTVKMFD